MLVYAMRSQSLPRFIQEAASVSEESSVDRVQDGEFSESLNGEQQHGADDHESDELWDRVSSSSNGLRNR